MQTAQGGPGAAAGIGALLLLALVGGCGSTTRAGQPEVPSPPVDGTSPAAQPSTAQEVRATGLAVTADEWTLWLVADALEVEAEVDGSQALTATAEPGADVTALVAAPEGTRFEVLDDGSAVVLDPAGVPVVGLTAPAETAWTGPGARFEVRAPDLLALTTAPVASATAVPGTEQAQDSGPTPTPGQTPGPEETPNRVMTVLGSASALTAVWGEAEGGRSLAVTPTGWVRAGGRAAEAVGWAAVLRSAPDAGTDGMQDQFACHVLGAANKATWNLEPWRPAVGYLATLVARCNP